MQIERSRKEPLADLALSFLSVWSKGKVMKDHKHGGVFCNEFLNALKGFSGQKHFKWFLRMTQSSHICYAFLTRYTCSFGFAKKGTSATFFEMVLCQLKKHFQKETRKSIPVRDESILLWRSAFVNDPILLDLDNKIETPTGSVFEVPF